MKNFFADDLLSTAKTAIQTASKTRDSLTNANIDKNKTAEKKESPILRGLIEETRKFGSTKNHPVSKKNKKNGLLMKC